MFIFRRHETPDLRPALYIEARLRADVEAERDRLRIQLECRDADVARLQKEVDDLKIGTLAKVIAITQRRDAERLRGRDRAGKFAGGVV